MMTDLLRALAWALVLIILSAIAAVVVVIALVVLIPSPGCAVLAEIHACLTR